MWYLRAVCARKPTTTLNPMPTTKPTTPTTTLKPICDHYKVRCLRCDGLTLTSKDSIVTCCKNCGCILPSSQHVTRVFIFHCRVPRLGLFPLSTFDVLIFYERLVVWIFKLICYLKLGDITLCDYWVLSFRFWTIGTLGFFRVILRSFSWQIFVVQLSFFWVFDVCF